MTNEARKSDLVDITCQIVRDTDKAWLIDDGTHQIWLPKSQIEVSFEDKFSIATMPEWLALEKKLI